MIEVYTYEGKNEEECRMNCFDNLDVYDNEIITKTFEENDLYKMDVIKKNDVENYINEFLTSLFEKMGIKISLFITEEDDIFNVKIKTKDNAIVIGKGGKNLSAFQIILRQAVRNCTNFNIKINLDVSNYKQHRDNLLEKDIKSIINEVLTSKTDTKLDPMNSYNRRIVHNVASNYYNIETESLGEEPERYVVIKYVEK